MKQIDSLPVERYEFDICVPAILTWISRAIVEKGWLAGTKRVSLFETISGSSEGSPLKLFTWRGTARLSCGLVWLHKHYREGISPCIVGCDSTVHSTASECYSSAFYYYFAQFSEMSSDFILLIRILEHNLKGHTVMTVIIDQICFQQ